MNSLSERGTARGQKKMEGVNMPASLKFAWRWIAGATAAAIIGVVALPGVGQAATLTICIKNSNGHIKGINVVATQMRPRSRPGIRLDHRERRDRPDLRARRA